MARKYEYIIHGPPLSIEPQTTSPRRSLTTRHQRRDSSLRNLYQDSALPTGHVDQLEPVNDHRISSPTTPKLPPTPPAVDVEDGPEQNNEITTEDEPSKLRSIPATPVQNNPPTPDDTPPRNTLKAPIRPFLALRPSIASTRAESFRTARENICSDDEFEPMSPMLGQAFISPMSPPELPKHPELIEDRTANEHDSRKLEGDHPKGTIAENNLPSSPTLPSVGPQSLSDEGDTTEQDTPETQFHFDPVSSTRLHQETSETGIRTPASIVKRKPVPSRSVHEQVTTTTEEPPRREKTLRDRLLRSKQIQPSQSIEAFASVIGWNDGSRSATDPSTKRWSANSNHAPVEAYVVDSPIKPRKRGTLRKVVKNDSLRSTSSPIPESKRSSLQSNSDSPHRLVHKKVKLGNENRWSVGSDISKWSLSWGSGPALPKPEIIRVAVIPERSSSLQTSASSSRRHSRSISNSSGQPRSSMPPVTSHASRRKRALSELIDKNLAFDYPPVVPVTSSSLSAPTSRTHSRANSITSEQFSVQRQQAERDLRSTLERMETERLSASLRRGSNQSSSPTPAEKQADKLQEVEASHPPSETQAAKKPSNADDSASTGRRPVTTGLNNVTPGTKDWADLRPHTPTGTPFSQTSMMSASPEIVEAKVISFFPHNNNSLQLIEPNRLSETPAVKALRDQKIGNPYTEPITNSTTPRTSNILTQYEQVDSPLRNPRKPPEPPYVQFTVIPPTPKGEIEPNFGPTPDASPIKSRNVTLLRNRPLLQYRERSESFINSLKRGLSLSKAKNPKAGEDLDSALHPFWRPKAFWDDDDYKQRVLRDKQQERERDLATTTSINNDLTISDRSMIIHRKELPRSNSITTGPVSLIRHISEKRRQRRLVDDHLAQQQALVKQTSYSSLQRFNAGRKLYGMSPVRAVSLNVGMARLKGLPDRVATMRARREDEKRERKREALRKSIGAEVISVGDSRFLNSDGDGTGMGSGNGNILRVVSSRKVDTTEQMLENARAEGLVGKRGLRL